MNNFKDNKALARELVRRLNALCEDERVRYVIYELMCMRVVASDEVVHHPTIQIYMEGGLDKVGLLGVLNGLVGTIPSGDKEGWGYITALCRETGGKGELVGFELTNEDTLRTEQG